MRSGRRATATTVCHVQGLPHELQTRGARGASTAIVDGVLDGVLDGVVDGVAFTAAGQDRQSGSVHAGAARHVALAGDGPGFPVEVGDRGTGPPRR